MLDPNVQTGSGNTQEAHTTKAISLVRVLPGFSGYDFNPQALLKATNYLHNLGRDAALKALQKYCALAAQERTTNPENALLAARILFICKDEKAILPRLPLGQPDPPEPPDLTLVPLFPLYLHQDLPLLLITGYMTGGEALPPSEYIEWCVGECDIRSKPLVPADDPVASVDQFLESSIWKVLNRSNTQKGMLRLQALRAVSNLYAIGKKDEVALLSVTRTDEIWRKYREAIASSPIKWNPETNEYE